LEEDYISSFHIPDAPYGQGEPPCIMVSYKQYNQLLEITEFKK